MNNLFDADNYKDEVPSELTAGSMFAWTRTDITAAYPTSLYTLKFHLMQLVSPFADYTITASKVSDAHVVQLTDTSDYSAGEYRWIARVTRDSDSAVVTVDEGLVTIRPAFGQDDGHTYRVLMAIRATLEGTATHDQSRIEVGGRVLEHRSVSELMALEREYSKRWARERADINRKAGRASGSRVLVKMEA